MSRRGRVAKRDVLPDPIYNSKVVTKLINNIMLDGKKGVAQNILYDAFQKVEAKTGNPAMEVFDQAINNIMPVLELKVRRIGGANYQVPVEVSPERRMTLGLRWLVNYSPSGFVTCCTVVSFRPCCIFSEPPSASSLPPSFPWLPSAPP